MIARARPQVPSLRPTWWAVTVVLALAAGVFAFSGSSSADVTAVKGSAYGYYANVSLFGGAASPRGPAPTVTLAPDAANSPQDAHVDSADAVYGPAVIFRSGRIDVHTEGALGPAGYVTSSSKVQGHPDRASRPGPLLYDGIESTCTADANGLNASTTITNGVVETKYDPQTQEPVQTQPVPANPPPGHSVEGTLDHVGDRFRIVFNEQTRNPDGTLTVNGAHMYLIGPIAVGDLIVGQSICGMTGTATATPVAGGGEMGTELETTPAAPAAGEDVEVADSETTAGRGFPLALVIIVALVLAAGAVLLVGFVRR